MDKVIELKDTVDMMTSSDYKDRFLAEYYQVKIRHDKLKAMREKWDKGELDFTPTCTKTVYDTQLKSMEDYIDVLKGRAIVENIDI